MSWSLGCLKTPEKNLGLFFTFTSYRQLSIPREKHPEMSRGGGHKPPWLWSQLDWTIELSETP